MIKYILRKQSSSALNSDSSHHFKMDLRLVCIFCFLVIIVNCSPVYRTPETVPWQPDGSTPLSQLNLLKMEQLAQQSPYMRGLFQNMFVSLAENFQSLIDRQQALIDMIYCKNCGSNPWQGFLNAMSNIPTLGWVTRPPNSQKPDGTFIAATNVNGMVNGVGGGIYDGDPIVEYTFNNNHVSPVRPEAIQYMAASQLTT